MNGKTLLVYYTRTGTTKTVADAIARELGCDVEEIVDTKKRAGAFGFVVAGKDAALKKLTVIAETTRNPADYDLVIIGTPVWANTMSCAIRTYLAEQRGRMPSVAFFLTTGRSGIESTLAQLEELSGKPPVATLALLARDVKKGEHLEGVRAFLAQVRAFLSDRSWPRSGHS